MLRAKGLSLEESQLALAALALLPKEREAALRTLLARARRRSVYVGNVQNGPLGSRAD